jgi:hypothetical protein
MSIKISGRMRRAGGGLMLVCALTALWGGGRVWAASGITGTVTDATTGKVVAGQKVTLTFFQDQTQLVPVTVVTDAKGAFSQPSPPAGATSLQTETVYRGADYRSEPVVLEAGKPVDLPLKVYAPTRDAAKVSATNWLVWVDPGSGGISVQQDVEWSNTGKDAYIGTGPPDKRSVTQVPISAGATDMQFLGLYLNGGGRVEGDTFVGTQPLVPGPSSATLRYTVTALTQLTLPITLPTQSLHVFVPAGYTVTAPGLIPGGQVTDRGTSYQVFTGTGLAPGDKVQVTLAAGAAPGSASSVPFIAAGIGLLVLVAAVFIVRRVRGERRPRPSVKSAARAEAADKPSTDDGEEALLIEEIAALDIAFEQGLLEKDVYDRLRTRAKNSLLKQRQEAKS